MLLMRSLFAWMVTQMVLTLTLCAQQRETYTVGTRGIRLILSSQGKIIAVRPGKNALPTALTGFASVSGCRQSGPAVVIKKRDGSIGFTRILVNDSLHRSCEVTETFSPSGGSIRWNLVIRGTGAPWGGQINTELRYPPGAHTRLWTAWGSPSYDSALSDRALSDRLRPLPGGSGLTEFIGPGNNQWTDPLVEVPFSDRTYYYGLPYYSHRQPQISICPFQGNILCIPMITVLEPAQDLGLSFALSPADDLVDLVLQTGRDGKMVFTRLFNRISGDHALHFSMDITAHLADWRAGLGWMAARYPGYFRPKQKRAFRLGGLGAYAGPFAVTQAARMHAMGFTTNWQASFDFPYMGMFLPPVKKNQPWKRFGDSTMTIGAMEAYATRMKSNGFHVLNYFNVTEFGTKVLYPPPAPAAGRPEDAWKDCNEFLYRNLSRAIFKASPRMARQEGVNFIPGGPVYTWEDGVVMDCGDSAYRHFLLDQARRHIREIPDADGICIDRMDWLRMFNEQADDGRTWFENRPARSLVHSFRDLMDSLGPLMHRGGKSIFVNNHDKRIDLLGQADGIFDEFTYAGSPLNLTALLCVYKPAMGWTDQAATVRKEGPDAFFQKYLYMGLYPMCPYPANDHSIMPDSLVDGYFLEYGPLFDLMRGRTWVLEPHAVLAENDAARVNLFKVPGGFVMPVMYGKSPSVRIHVRMKDSRGRLLRIASAQIWYPGKKKGVAIPVGKEGHSLVLDVPLVRGCAMVCFPSRDLLKTDPR